MVGVQSTEYEYDSLGRRVATYSGWFQAADATDGGTIKWFRHKSVTNYDTGDSGRVVSEVTGIIVKQNLDNSGLVTDSSHAVTTSFDYDHLGNVIRTTVVDASTTCLTACGRICAP